MLRIDSRTGSKELAPLFTPFGIKPEVCRLDYGDIDWIGKGPHGDCAVVVERKRLSIQSTDMLDSMTTKRLSGHQLPGMADTYDYGYLLVEGIWRPDREGRIELYTGGKPKWRATGVHYAALNNYLSGLCLRAGLMRWRTASPEETVWWLVSEYNMWQKPWGEHRCHEAIYSPSVGAEGRRITLVPREITLDEEVAARLPGLDTRARWVAKHFGSVEAMVEAGVEEWARVKCRDKKGKVRRLGEAEARKIVEAPRWRKNRPTSGVN